MPAQSNLPCNLSDIVGAVLGRHTPLDEIPPETHLPVSSPPAAPPATVYVLLTHSPGGRTWTTLDPEYTWGRPTCAILKIRALHQRYPIETEIRHDDNDVVKLLADAWHLHGIPLALTETYRKQAWSVVAPAPRCADCANRGSSQRAFVNYFSRLLGGDDHEYRRISNDEDPTSAFSDFRSTSQENSSVETVGLSDSCRSWLILPL